MRSKDDLTREVLGNLNLKVIELTAEKELAFEANRQLAEQVTKLQNDLNAANTELNSLRIEFTLRPEASEDSSTDKIRAVK